MSFSPTVYPSPIPFPTGPGWWWVRCTLVTTRTKKKVVNKIFHPYEWYAVKIVQRNDATHNGLYIENDMWEDVPPGLSSEENKGTSIIFEYVGPLPLPS